MLEKVSYLVKHSIPVFGSVVMTPQLFKEIQCVEDSQQAFAQIDVPLLPKALRGDYRGKFYPQDYTYKERETFIRLSLFAEQVTKKSNWTPSIVNPLVDKEYLDGVPDFTGKLCSAGRTAVVINPDGNIYRCGEKNLLGNIFTKDLGLWVADAPCDNTYCPYWCLHSTGFHHATSGEYKKVQPPLTQII